jgi:hypothetical protein
MTKLALIEKALKIIKKDYGNEEVCRDFRIGCGACTGYLLIGLLSEYRDNLKWEEEV